MKKIVTKVTMFWSILHTTNHLVNKTSTAELSIETMSKNFLKTLLVMIVTVLRRIINPSYIKYCIKLFQHLHSIISSNISPTYINISNHKTQIRMTIKLHKEYEKETWSNLWVTATDDLGIREFISKANHEAPKGFVAVEAAIMSSHSLNGDIGRRRGGGGWGGGHDW